MLRFATRPTIALAALLTGSAGFAADTAEQSPSPLHSPQAIAPSWVQLAAGARAHDSCQACKGQIGCIETPDFAACLMPGTSERMLSLINQHMELIALQTQGEGGVAFHLGPRWSPQTQGNPITLRWSIVPDGLMIPGSPTLGEPDGPSILQQRLTQVFGSVENGLQRFRLVYDRWEYLTGIDFIEVTDDGAAWGAAGPATLPTANRGDIRIGMHIFGFGGTLAYAGFPNGGDIVMNGTINWNQPANNYRFLRNVLAHESGHAIGMRHNCPENDTKLMEPTISLAFDGPQHDDIRGGQRHYGDRFEANDTIAAATALGPGPSIDVLDVSLDDDGDVDIFSFVAGPNQQVDIIVTPVGLIYEDAQETAGDICPATGATIISQSILDLRVRLISTDGLTVLLTVDTNPAGGPERILDYDLPGAGTYFVRVTGTGADDIQTYKMDIDLVDIAPPTCAADLNGSGVVDGLDLGILLAQWGTGGAADLNGSGSVDGIDLGILLAQWGLCD